MSHSVVVTNQPDSQARALIGDGLDAYNVARTGIVDNTPLDVLVLEDGVVIGGLVGRTSLGVLFVDYFHLPESLRGKGFGSRILAAAETEAIGRSCVTAFLFTMEIHSPSFYTKRGYVPFGRIDCNPPGNARIFMKKELRP